MEQNEKATGIPLITGSTKELYITGNPGTIDCDTSIAENKGWIFM